MTQKKSIEDYILPLDETIKKAAIPVKIGVEANLSFITLRPDVAVSLLTYTIKYQKMLEEKHLQELHDILLGENQEKENAKD